MTLKILKPFVLLSILLLGCEGRVQTGQSLVTSSGSTGQTRDAESTVESKDTGASDKTQAPVTRKDVDTLIARMDDTSKWHYAERSAGELVGTWVADDGSGHQLEFGVNGLFREDFNGNMTTGLFAISDRGRIVAFSRWQGISLSSHFRFDGQAITGPKGPNPNARWIRKVPSIPATKD